MSGRTINALCIPPTDVALSSTKFRFVNIFTFALFTVVYLCFSRARRAVTDDLIYTFLDPWDVGPAIGLYLGTEM